MSDYIQNQDRTAKRCTIFDVYNSAGSHVSNTLTISILEDLRGDECSFSTDPTVISNVLADFSGDVRYKMKVSQDPTHEGLILTLTDSTEHSASTSRTQSNRIGCTERDEETGLLWYGRGPAHSQEKEAWML